MFAGFWGIGNLFIEEIFIAYQCRARGLFLTKSIIDSNRKPDGSSTLGSNGTLHSNSASLFQQVLHLIEA